MPLFNKNTNVIELTPTDFDIKNKKIIHPSLKDKKGMVAYMADWCGHCKRLSPVYDSVSSSLGESFPLFYMDCEKYSDFASKKLNVVGFPTILYIDRNGKPYKQYSGERSEIGMMQDICKESQICNRRR